MMLSSIFWYLIISALGLLTFPIVYRFLPALPDRGYAFSRIFGILLWGYIFWLFGCLGILNNDLGGILFALVLVIVFSGYTLQNIGWHEIAHWIRTQRKMVIIVEVLFLTAFAVCAIVRAANPEIIGTEKPMELAFINAILRSPTLPPNDPWLSGYTISYYYFGYILVAMIARLAGTPGEVAFNLGISLVFALSAVGSFGLLFNLLNYKRSADLSSSSSSGKPGFYFSALLGPFFNLIISNLGGLLHILRITGVFWKVDESGNPVSQIWSWLDIGRFAQPPPVESFPHWWWWQASRIVQDFDFNWVNKGDIIDEFPFFSFLLADLHPHVLAMPFALLAITLALNLFWGGGKGQIPWLNFHISPVAFGLAAFVLGGLAFFNTWDFPFYVALFVGAYILRELNFESESDLKSNLGSIIGVLITLGLALGISGVFLYLPFYFGFQSQAGGLLPNLIYITRGVYFWIHFGVLLVPIFGYLLYLRKSGTSTKQLLSGLKLTAGLVAALMSIALFLAVLIANIRIFEKIIPEAAVAGDAFLGSLGTARWLPLIVEGFRRRLTVPGTGLTLFVLLSLTIALLWPRSRKADDPHLVSPPMPLFPSHLFVLLLILVGGLLVLTPEFVFLRDLFGYRINTIFKFYFQVWLMWGIAAAYAVTILWHEMRNPGRIIFQISIVLLFALSLTYPVMGLWSKTNGFQPNNGFTLDGTAYLKRSTPDEAAAMMWLRDAPLGVIAEAVGGSYTQYARMAANTGQPTVLGWEFHEMQWRGGTDEMGTRRVDIERLYCTNNWDETLDIIHRYKIRYVIVGTVEYSAYGTGSSICPGGLNETKFSSRFSPVFQQGSTTIYQVPDQLGYP